METTYNRFSEYQRRPRRISEIISRLAERAVQRALDAVAAERRSRAQQPIVDWYYAPEGAEMWKWVPQPTYSARRIAQLKSEAVSKKRKREECIGEDGLPYADFDVDSD